MDISVASVAAKIATSVVAKIAASVVAKIAASIAAGVAGDSNTRHWDTTWILETDMLDSETLR